MVRIEAPRSTCLCRTRHLKCRAVNALGPRIMNLIFQFHGEMFFNDGMVNADPHAGNIMLMDDGRVGMLEVGDTQQPSLCPHQGSSLCRTYRLWLCAGIVGRKADCVRAIHHCDVRPGMAATIG